MNAFLIRATLACAMLALHLPLMGANMVSLLPPTDDPFYTPPRDYKKTAPGTILRHRVMPAPLILVGNTTANIKTGFQLLYRTTDALGHAQATVTTLLVPHDAHEDRLVSYQMAEDSACLNCSPSYSLLQGTKADPTHEIYTIAAALHHGWYVSVPDYEGPKSAYAVGPQAAHATLDNIRAVLSSGGFSNLSCDARTVMWGYSGGSLASEWAAEFVSSYAPDLKPRLVGAALGGLTPNVSSVIETVNKGSFAGFVPTGYLGYACAYANFSKYLNAHLLPSTAAAFRVPRNECLDAVLDTFAGQDIFTYFKNGTEPLSDPVPASVIAMVGIMGLRGTPSTPLYFYKAIADEISVVSDTDALYNKYCSGGGSVSYQRNRFGEHLTDFIVGAPGALAWLKDRLEGKEEARGCLEKNVTIDALHPADISLLGKASYEFMKLVLAGEIAERGL